MWLWDGWAPIFEGPAQPTRTANPDPTLTRPNRRYADERDPLLWSPRHDARKPPGELLSGSNGSPLRRTLKSLITKVREGAMAAYNICLCATRVIRLVGRLLLFSAREVHLPWSSLPSVTEDRTATQSLISDVDDSPGLSYRTSIYSTDSSSYVDLLLESSDSTSISSADSSVLFTRYVLGTIYHLMF